MNEIRDAANLSLKATNLAISSSVISGHTTCTVAATHPFLAIRLYGLHKSLSCSSGYLNTGSVENS